MAFWPLGSGNGEPDELRYRAGRINYCLKRIKTDSPCLGLFGSATRATAALCQFELCLELNSYLATPNDDTSESYAYVSARYPDMCFTFWPSLIAFPLDYISALALRIFSDIKKRNSELVALLLIEPALAGFLLKPGGELILARCVSNLAADSAQLHFQLHRFPPMVAWPPELNAAMKSARQAARKK